MGYRSTRQLSEDLIRHQRMLVIDQPVDPYLELAEIHRRVYRHKGPALLFTNVTGTRFPVATNLFGTIDRARFIFRHQIDAVKTAVALKTDPGAALTKPWGLWKMPLLGLRMLPRKLRRAPVMRNRCRLSELPQIVCWPRDGGAFVTLPQVFSRFPGSKRMAGINLGMYRVQLSGNDYIPDKECGLHYQIHRGIGVHHAEAIRRGEPLPVNVAIGGTPAMTLSAVMPLPEGMSELGFAGALAGHRIPIVMPANRAPIYADADFCIVGSVSPNELKPEGPFGDHLGYYAKVHDFPYLSVESVYYREDAVWPMTVVGRPPQEDTTFGELIHELTGPVIPTVLPGVRQVHAVDAAGVHPLLLAVGSERYTPYQEVDRPQELLTQACAILGQGQLSLAKYLFIIDGQDPLSSHADNIPEFFQYLLSRVDWRQDLHFLTQTTIDTLDYSGSALNQGSKLIIASGRRIRRQLAVSVPPDLQLPTGWQQPAVPIPGVLAVTCESHRGEVSNARFYAECDQFSRERSKTEPAQSQRFSVLDASMPDVRSFPLIVLVDDSGFASRSIENFLWVVFTRSNPAVDVYGFCAMHQHKHFGCGGSLVIDARSKPQHAEGLVEDPEVLKKVDARAARGGPLSTFL